MSDKKEDLVSQLKDMESLALQSQSSTKDGAAEKSDVAKRQREVPEDLDEVKRLKNEIAALKSEDNSTIKKLRSEISSLKSLEKKTNASESDALVEAIHKLACAISEKSPVATHVTENSSVKEKCNWSASVRRASLGGLQPDRFFFCG